MTYVKEHETQLMALHDATLQSVVHDRNGGEVILSFELPGGEVVKMTLSGLEQARCVDLGLQNVVLQVVVANVSEHLDPDELRRNVEWVCASAEGERLVPQAQIQKLIEAIEREDLILVRIIPSWGADFRAIARGFRFSPSIV